MVACSCVQQLQQAAVVNSKRLIKKVGVSPRVQARYRKDKTVQRLNVNDSQSTLVSTLLRL
jgi:hypothetical protein